MASGSGQSLDLSAGTFATVSTGGTEDVFDGDNNFSISMWMKGWPANVNQSILSKSLIPTLKGISPKLWLDAADSSTVFNSSTLSTLATSSVGGWMDKSGNANHATQITSGDQPTFTGNGMSGKAYWILITIS